MFHGLTVLLELIVLFGFLLSCVVVLGTLAVCGLCICGEGEGQDCFIAVCCPLPRLAPSQ